MFADYLTVFAVSKLAFYATVLALLFVIARGSLSKSPWMIGGILTISFGLFYLIFGYPMKTLLWGNHGDETYILAFFSQVLLGSPFQDFYYAHLPPFYPPLYFWTVGLLSRLFVETGIGAAKLGVLLTLLSWIPLPFLLQSFFWRFRTSVVQTHFGSPWLWLLFPALAFITLDVDTILFKPYEAFSALLCVLWITLLSVCLHAKHWSKKTILSFGLSGSLLFLTFHFWWFALLPVLALLVVLSPQKKQSLTRILCIGLVMLLVSLPYTLPLVLSLIRYGSENWQIRFFIPEDLHISFPWSALSLKHLLLTTGFVGLLLGWKHEKHLRPALYLFVYGYLWQAVQTVVFLTGHRPIFPSKFHLFLGGACLALGASWLFVELGQRVYQRWGLSALRLAGAFAVLLFFAPLLPFSFLDSPAVKAQWERNRLSQPDQELAERIEMSVPDWQDRLWLTSGTEGLNGYLPLHAFIASNPNFSHPASIWSERLARIEALTQAPDPVVFTSLLKGTADAPNALLFFQGAEGDTYPLFFFEDAYPHGGREKRLDLPRSLIDPSVWSIAYQNRDWIIYLR